MRNQKKQNGPHIDQMETTERIKNMCAKYDDLEKKFVKLEHDLRKMIESQHLILRHHHQIVLHQIRQPCE